MGAFSKYTQLSLLEQPCPRSDYNAVENNSYKVYQTGGFENISDGRGGVVVVHNWLYGTRISLICSICSFCGVSIPTEAYIMLAMYGQLIRNWEVEKVQTIVPE